MKLKILIKKFLQYFTELQFVLGIGYKNVHIRILQISAVSHKSGQ